MSAVRLCYSIASVFLAVGASACVGTVSLGGPGDAGGGPDAGTNAVTRGAPNDGSKVDASAATTDGGRPDGRAVSDAVADAGWTGVLCGSASCTQELPVCCVTGNAPAEWCVAADAGGSCGLIAACDGPESCAAGAVCCGPSGERLETQCVQGGCAAQTLCHGDSDCGGATPKCCPTELAGWKYSECSAGPACEQ